MSATRIIPTEKGGWPNLFYRQQLIVSRESAIIFHVFCPKKPNEVHTGNARRQSFPNFVNS